MKFDRIMFGLFCAAILLTAAGAVRAATYTVTNTGDTGAGSLRQAVADANATAANDTISFSIPATDTNCAGGVCTIILSSGQITATNNGTLAINGTGANNLRVSGNNQSRVFYINGANVTVSELTVRDGRIGDNPNESGAGAGILNRSGSVTIRNCYVTANTNLSGANAGISNTDGTMTIDGCAVTSNTVSYPTDDSGAVIITGAGIESTSSSGLTVRNSTVSGNVIANGSLGFRNCAGGIFLQSPAFITNTTVTDNEVVGVAQGTSGQNCGGGIFIEGDTPTFQSSIIAADRNNTATPDVSGGSGLRFISQGFNFIGNPDSLQNITYQATDQVGTTAAPLDPQLDPLAFNGGTTPTHSPKAGSSVIDKGKSNGLITDQRGSTRPFDMASIPNATGGDGADIGAFEIQQVQTSTPAPSGLASWYKGENNALDSRSQNNGAIQGNVTYAAGEVGQTFRLGGTGDLNGSGDRVLVANPANLQLQDFTIETWIRRASSTVVTNSPFTGSAGGTFFAYGQNGYGFIIDQNTNRLGLTNFGNSVVNSTTTITDTTFHHVVVTKSGNQVTFYIDGAANAPVTYNTTFGFTTNAAIGARGDSNVQNAFFGDIDELSIYNRALTASEVQAIYNAG